MGGFQKSCMAAMIKRMLNSSFSKIRMLDSMGWHYEGRPWLQFLSSSFQKNGRTPDLFLFFT